MAATSSIVFCIGLVTGFVYWFGNKTLYLSHLDAQSWQISFDRKWERGIFSSASSLNYLNGLAVRDFPSLLFLDVPNVLARVIGGEFHDWVFGAANAALLFSTSAFLGSELGLSRPSAAFVGLTTVSVTVLPSPISWTQFHLHMANVIWLLSLFCVALKIFLSLGRVQTRKLFVVRVLGLVFVNVLMTLMFPTSAPIWLISFGLASVGPLTRWTKEIRSRKRYACLLLVLVSTLVHSAFVSYQSLSKSAIAANLASYRGLVLKSDWMPYLFFELDASPIPFYREVIIAISVVGAIFLHIRQGWRATASVSVPLLLAFLFAQVGPLVNKQLGREIFPSGNYVFFFLLPLLAISVTVGLRACFEKIAYCLSAPLGKLRRNYASVICVALFLWSGIWALDNRHLRQVNTRYPAEYGQLPDGMKDLRWPIGGSFKGRVLILQGTESVNDLGSDPILLPTGDEFRLLLALQRSQIPVFNTYSHMISPELVKLTYRYFVNELPTLRNHLVANRLNNVEPLLLLGIRYVLTSKELSIPNFRPLGVLTGFEEGEEFFVYEVNGVNNGITIYTSDEVGSLNFTPVIGSQSKQVKELIGEAREIPQSEPDVTIRRETQGLKINIEGDDAVVVRLPFQVDSCMSFHVVDGIALPVRLEDDLLGLVVDRRATIRVGYKHHLGGMISCA